MIKTTDQLGQNLVLPGIPQRIISLVPSQTELLFDLGLRQSIVGITKFCERPVELVHNVPKVGGTKNLKFHRVEELSPDLIIANKEENVKEQVEELMHDYPVWISNVRSLEDNYSMIRGIAGIFDKSAVAERTIGRIEYGFNKLSEHVSVNGEITGAVYFIWRKPYMTAGIDTFIDYIMKLAGFENMMSSELSPSIEHFINPVNSRYPELSIEFLEKLNPKVLLLSSEPFPFNENHLHELKSKLPDAELILVDGQMFSWYGSRMQYSPKYLMEIREQILKRITAE